jgi:hypothetical protein
MPGKHSWMPPKLACRNARESRRELHGNRVADEFPPTRKAGASRARTGALLKRLSQHFRCQKVGERIRYGRGAWNRSRRGSDMPWWSGLLGVDAFGTGATLRGCDRS